MEGGRDAGEVPARWPPDFFNEQRLAEDGSPHQQIGGARRPAEPPDRPRKVQAMSKITTTKQLKEQGDAAFATMQTRDEARARAERQRVVNTCSLFTVTCSLNRKGRYRSGTSPESHAPLMSQARIFRVP